MRQQQRHRPTQAMISNSKAPTAIPTLMTMILWIAAAETEIEKRYSV